MGVSAGDLETGWAWQVQWLRQENEQLQATIHNKDVVLVAYRWEYEQLRQERDRLKEEFAAYRATSEEHVTSLINGRRESFNRAKVAESENARLRALLRECAGYLDYMEGRGYSSVRTLRSDVRAELDGGKE